MGFIAFLAFPVFNRAINGIKKGYQTILRNDQLFESLDTITCEVITKNRDRLWDKANREFIIRGLSELNNIIKEIGELHLEHVRNYHLNTPQEKNKSIKRKPDRSFPYINENTGDFFESFTAYLNNVNPKNRAQENEIKYALLQYVRVHREL